MTMKKRPVGRSVEALIRLYEPDIDPAVWQRIRPLFVEIMFALNPSPARTHNIKHLVAGLLAWSDAHLVARDVEDLFSRDTIEQYVNDRYSERSRATARSRLRTLGEALTADGGYAGKAPALGRTLLQPPYSDSDLRALGSDAAHQPDVQLRHLFEVFLALGLGVGTSASDAKSIGGRDFVWQPEGLVSYVGASRREVPVLPRFRHCLEEAARAAGADFLLPGKETKSKVSDVAARFKLGTTTPPLTMSRLRNTWLVCLMSSRVSIPDILAVAGLRTTDTLRDLLPYVRVSERGPFREQFQRIDGP